MGQTDIFVDNLPGYPDNIRPSGRGTFWVGMAVIRRAGDWQYLDVLSTYPWIRSFLLKVLSVQQVSVGLTGCCATIKVSGCC